MLSPDTAGTRIRGYLESALTAESYLLSQMEKYASLEGDDDEARALFGAEAESSFLRQERLRTRLQGSAHEGSSVQIQSESLFTALPQAEHSDRNPEERLLHALIAAYTIETGARALYESLYVVAGACGDTVTGELAREIEDERRRAAQDFFHLLSSRSKIAFNMLTFTEVDPSVQTKVADGLL